MASERRLAHLAASLRPPPPPADDSHVQPEAVPLRIAFAGVHRSVMTENGSWPSNSHNWASAFAASADTSFSVVGVYDHGSATRDEFVGVWAERADWRVPAFDDFDDMLRRAKPDILVIGTRQTYHSSQIVRAIHAGVRGIACDKPLVTCLSESDEIYQAFAAAQAAGKPVAFA